MCRSRPQTPIYTTHTTEKCLQWRPTTTNQPPPPSEAPKRKAQAAADKGAATIKKAKTVKAAARSAKDSVKVRAVRFQDDVDIDLSHDGDNEESNGEENESDEE